MPSEPSDLQVPPPKDHQAFERHLHHLLQAEWGPDADLHGRSGQAQSGIDIYGRPNGDNQPVKRTEPARIVDETNRPSSAPTSRP